MIINTDGGSRGNPGPGACGIVIKDQNGIVSKKVGKFLGLCTNNEAEYQGLILALETALELQADTLEILMDSELVVKQLQGLYRVKEPRLVPLFTKVKHLEHQLDTVSYYHIPRAQNSLADAVVNQVLDSQQHA